MTKTVELGWDRRPSSQDSDLLSTFVGLPVWGHRGASCMKHINSEPLSLNQGRRPRAWLSLVLHLFSLSPRTFGEQFKNHWCGSHRCGINHPWCTWRPPKLRLLPPNGCVGLGGHPSCFGFPSPRPPPRGSLGHEPAVLLARWTCDDPRCP